MPPKKKSKSSASSSSSFDSNEFVSLEGENRYNDMVVYKKCFSEWDFNDLELYMRKRLRTGIGSCLHSNHSQS